MRILLFLLLTFSLQAQDVEKFETFYHYIEVDLYPPSNDIKVNKSIEKSGYILITSDSIFIVDQFGTTIKYKYLFTHPSIDEYYYLNSEDYIYIIRGHNVSLFSIHTRRKNYHYRLNQNS